MKKIFKCLLKLSYPIYLGFSNTFLSFSSENQYDQKSFLVQDSDYLSLEVKPSAIPNSGFGLFALKTFEPDEIIAEFRGAVIDSNRAYDKIYDNEDRMVYINDKYSVIARSLAGYANDCVIYQNKPFSKENYLQWEEDETFPIHEKCKYNAVIETKGNKVFLKATERIAIGEEIYVSYGWDYWSFFFKSNLIHSR